MDVPPGAICVCLVRDGLVNLFHLGSVFADDQRVCLSLPAFDVGLELEALGQQGKEFKVEENTTFALPSDGAKKDYLLKTVTPESITVEYTDAAGEKKSVTISKGGLPKMGD